MCRFRVDGDRHVACCVGAGSVCIKMRVNDYKHGDNAKISLNKFNVVIAYKNGSSKQSSC